MRKVISVGDPGRSRRTSGVRVTTPPSTSASAMRAGRPAFSPRSRWASSGSRPSASRRPQVGLGRRASTAGSISAASAQVEGHGSTAHKLATPGRSVLRETAARALAFGRSNGAG